MIGNVLSGRRPAAHCQRIPTGRRRGAAGTFGGGGDRLPSSTQESTGRPPARDATPPFNLSSSDLGPQTWDLRGCSQWFESSLIVCRSSVSSVPIYPGVHRSSTSTGCNLCSKAVQLSYDLDDAVYSVWNCHSKKTLLRSSKSTQETIRPRGSRVLCLWSHFYPGHVIVPIGMWR